MDQSSSPFCVMHGKNHGISPNITYMCMHYTTRYITPRLKHSILNHGTANTTNTTANIAYTIAPMIPSVTIYRWMYPCQTPPTHDDHYPKYALLYSCPSKSPNIFPPISIISTIPIAFPPIFISINTSLNIHATASYYKPNYRAPLRNTKIFNINANDRK